MLRSHSAPIWLFVFALIFGCASLAHVDAEAAVKEKYPKLFGSTERRFRSMKPFKKWTGMLKRNEKERPIDGRPCDPAFHDECELSQWTDFLDSIRDEDAFEKITAINSYHNQAKYLTDQLNWKQKDYWETVAEFFARNGDCEDFSIAKYMSLRAVGFKASEVRILVVQDLNLKVGHAILVVYLDGKAYILDNQVNEVMEVSRIRHYRVQYSINEKYWWRHRYR